MKLHNITESTIAHVGASKNPQNPEHQIWSDNDKHHIDSVWKWLEHYGRDEMLKGQDDWVDLQDGRDFLHENNKYDIVILHHIYNPPQGDEDYHKNINQSSPYKVSGSHDKYNWVSRLAATGAEYIFTFGSHGEVSGQYLGEIPGYDGPTDAGNDMQVYMSLAY